MGTISCHSNQSYPIGIKTIYVEKIFLIFFENLPFMWPRQLIKLSDLDKSHMKRGRLLYKHTCEKKSNISNETVETVNFHFSHFKSMGTISCHSNQSYPIGIKTIYVEAIKCHKHVCKVSALSTLHFLKIFN